MAGQVLDDCIKALLDELARLRAEPCACATERAARLEAWRSKYDDACAVLKAPDSTNDGGTDLADDVRCLRDNYNRVLDELEAAQAITCPCGIYVHPSRWNPKARHIYDCPWQTQADLAALKARWAQLREWLTDHSSGTTDSANTVRIVLAYMAAKEQT